MDYVWQAQGLWGCTSVQILFTSNHDPTTSADSQSLLVEEPVPELSIDLAYPPLFAEVAASPPHVLGTRSIRRQSQNRPQPSLFEEPSLNIQSLLMMDLEFIAHFHGGGG
ncbi:uncharacterized protein N7483_003124, partial [Penicillium malachiteum]|uniref:uncharacterized protein n=1 Tax=Penicillium malachiteum TaxID=1324776 RepID=UPI002548E803